MKSINIFLIALIIFCSESTSAQDYDSTYGRPIIVLIETNPCLMVIGSDVPTFAMYENGQIIYKKVEDKQLKTYEVKLTKAELQEIIKSFSISDSIYKIDTNITASNATDQPTNNLYLDITSKKMISVYGVIGGNSSDRNKVPEQFLNVYDRLKNYTNKSAKEWLPKKIEVMFWDYNHAPKTKNWPSDFPDLDSKSTKHFGGSRYSVFIDIKYLSKFKRFYKSLEEKQAVIISGRKMSISPRIPFPNINFAFPVTY